MICMDVRDAFRDLSRERIWYKSVDCMICSMASSFGSRFGGVGSFGGGGLGFV